MFLCGYLPIYFYHLDDIHTLFVFAMTVTSYLTLMQPDKLQRRVIQDHSVWRHLFFVTIIGELTLSLFPLMCNSVILGLIFGPRKSQVTVLRTERTFILGSMVMDSRAGALTFQEQHFFIFFSQIINIIHRVIQQLCR